MSAENDKPLFWYVVEDCYFCNCTGIILVQSSHSDDENQVECPMCNGRGYLKKAPKPKKT